MTNRAEFERLLDVYGFRCERFGQDLSTHARAQVVSAFAALASAPVAEEQFKAAFPNGVLPVEKYHELWERAGEQRNPNYTLLENLTWQVGMFGDLVAKEASAPVAGVAQKPVAKVVDGGPFGPTLRFLGNGKPLPKVGTMLYAAPQASEADALIDALGQCRDAFPLPDIVGSKLDLLWQEAMSDPSAVPAYIKARAALSAQPGAQRTGGSDAG
ncbi:hypothetical protein [Achromobacter denitrificans]|uniref:hypothetical protein n=1 Tax=Achromobacter denitrificans TaxID=32002 RepID=UPI0029B77B1E|nr:hypothetical protein [Achromobacter sp.]